MNTTQVKNNYDTEELSGAHEQPLDSCIEDCEHGMYSLIHLCACTYLENVCYSSLNKNDLMSPTYMFITRVMWFRVGLVQPAERFKAW